MARNVASTSAVSGDQLASCSRLGGPAARSSARARACTCAVLPDLQAGQVEAERLGLPDQVLQLAEGLLGRAGRGQRLLDQAQVGQELAGSRVGQVGVPDPGGAEPLGGVQQVGPVRLLRRPGGDLGQQLGVGRRGGGQRPAQAGGGGVVAACRVSARPILVVAFSRARRMWSAWIVAVSRVTWAVTNGLPSRSAPTQLPNRRYADTGEAPAAHGAGASGRRTRPARGRAPGTRPGPPGTASRRTRP